MFGRGLLRRLVVLVVLTLVTAVVVPGVMAPSASADGCSLNVNVGDVSSLIEAVDCYNDQSPAGDYTITLTSDIEIGDHDDVEIDSDTDSGDLTIDGSGYKIFGDGYDEDYQLFIDNPGTGIVYIKDITFEGADDDAIEFPQGWLEVSDSTFTDNSYGIYGDPDCDLAQTSTLRVTDSSFTGTENNAIEFYSAFDIEIKNSFFDGVDADESAIYLENKCENAYGESRFVISDSNVMTSSNSYGIDAYGAVDIEVNNSLFSSNEEGLSLDNGESELAVVTVSDSTFIGNESSFGVKLIGNVDALISNSTFTLHDVGIYFDIDTLKNGGAGVVVSNSTVVNNGEGFFVYSPISVRSSILAENEDDCFEAALTSVCSDEGNNFRSGETSPPEFTLLSEGSLGELADNGCVIQTPNGCVPTIELLAGSNAIGAGSCTDLLTDQRGFLRSGSCDAGAYQRNGIAPTSEAGSAAPVPYPGPFTQMPELAGAPYGWGTSPVAAASPETPTAASPAGDGVAGLAYTGTTTTTLAYLAVGLIGFGALLVPVSRRRN